MRHFKLTIAQSKAMDTLTTSAMHNSLGGGSRSGKTFLFVRAILIRALKAPNSRHVVFRFRFNALRSSIIADTLPKVLRMCFPQLPALNSMMNRTDWFLELPNGSQVWFCGLDDSDRVEKVLGMEFATQYYNECSQIPWHSVELSLSRLAQSTDGVLRLKAYYDFNPPSKRHWTYRVFIEKKNPVSGLPHRNEFDYTFYLINPADNQENLDPRYLELLNSFSEAKRNRFLLGKFADDDDAQLWTVEVVESGRRADLPEILRVVVGVDPSGDDGAAESSSDAIGIVVTALGVDGHAYVLADYTLNAKPEQWASVVNDAFHRHAGDIIVGESNFGGDMVRAVIHSVNSQLPYKSVTASRGKAVRAEPIASLYDQGKVHHVGRFPELEDEMLAMLTSGRYMGHGSPNRVDALVWALTELFYNITKHDENSAWRQPSVVSAGRSASRFTR